MPSWTYGRSCAITPLEPARATCVPSATVLPRAVVMVPRWRSVTTHPSGVVIVTVRPPLGTEPAKVTMPLAGASTGSPPLAAMSMPRCWPAAYGSSP
jgi:hypothetical protein